MLEEERRHLIEEKCGVFGIVGHNEAAHMTYLGLHALQHRGQESAGIVTWSAEGMSVQRRTGLVSEGFTEEVLETLPGPVAIGHVRYSTTGGTGIKNAQPLTFFTKFGRLALAHNGNLTNAVQLRKELEAEGSIFGTATDTEVIAHLIARSQCENIVDALVDALQTVTGAYSLLALTEEHLIACRDPNGVRPLVLGRVGESSAIASEPVSFGLMGGVLEREIEPGEMLILKNSDGERVWRKPFDVVSPTPCIFELVYFARPDNTIFGRDVYETRKEMGRTLAREAPAEADLVIPVPDSGVPAALGYAQASGLPFEMGLVRSHYIGRTFIEPSNSIRHFGVKLKLSPVRSLIEGKRIVVVDDSIVRGTTCRKIIKMLREAGAAEIHFRVSSPPTTHPCFYGIDTPERSQLIAFTHTVEETRRYITADTLAYLSREGLFRSASATIGQMCDACFTGEYPIRLESESRFT